jgi:hypothetical protein
LKGNEIYKELKSTLIILSFIGLIFLLIYLGNNYYTEKLTPFLVTYLFASIILIIIASYIKNRYFEKIVAIISFPIGLIYSIMILIVPFSTLLIHLIYYFALAISIPFLLFKGLHYFHIIDFIKKPTELYLRITMTVFISVLLNKLIREITYRIAPVRSRSSQKMKTYELDKLTDYFLSADNIRFFIYSFYVIALLTTNFFNFQGQSFNTTTEIDKSILQSFVTFIAFDKVLTLSGTLDFRPSKLLSKINQSISNKIEKDIIDKKTSH